MKTEFKVGQKVMNTKTGRIREIAKIESPTRVWLKNKPGTWVWLVFVGQIGGFCSSDYVLIGE